MSEKTITTLLIAFKEFILYLTITTGLGLSEVLSGSHWMTLEYFLAFLPTTVLVMAVCKKASRFD
jgi:hypothetical protein